VVAREPSGAVRSGASANASRMSRRSGRIGLQMTENHVKRPTTFASSSRSAASRVRAVSTAAASDTAASFMASLAGPCGPAANSRVPTHSIELEGSAVFSD